jgi:hypothetical protein
MKVKTLTILSLTLGLIYTRYLDEYNKEFVPNIAFSSSLNCGACIVGGYNWCISYPEHMQLEVGQTQPQSVCINGTSKPETNDTSYSCSTSFTDRVYKKFVCPYSIQQCG